MWNDFLKEGGFEAAMRRNNPLPPQPQQALPIQAYLITNFGGCVSTSTQGWSPTVFRPPEPFCSFEGTVHGVMEVEE